MAVVIGLDIGTTSTKAVVFAQDGQVLGKHAVHYPLYQPDVNRAEQDPDEIMRAVMEAVKEAVTRAGVRPAEIVAIGFSSAMHSLMLVDKDYRPLTKVITWADNRSAAQAERLRRNGEGLALYKQTGTPIHPMSPLTKLLWFKEEESSLIDQAAKCISIKEYVLYQLFETEVIDYSIASATGLFDLTTLTWNEAALKLVGLDKSKLSQPVPTTTVLTGMNKELAEKMNLDPMTPFVIGASDGVLANLGVGATEAGEVAVTIGTSGAVRAMVPSPLTDAYGRTFCYALTEDCWVVGGPSNNGGILMRWLRDNWFKNDRDLAQLTEDEQYQWMVAEAANISAGAEGLLCLPYFAGERAPLWNPDARGVLFGMSLHHTRAHVIRAMVEGICFSILSISRVLEELAGQAKVVYASGGFARSPEWRQIMANVLGRKLLMPQSTEASALGAAALALYGLGEMKTLGDVKKWIHIQEEYPPMAVEHQVYQGLYPLYEHLSHHLTDEFQRISSFQQGTR
ncbi:gluconokinase [Laceyella putida]|uniref:Gluconokinase n=1 Tax=Laceyella putida TaxID=110101 RepID=A0ABW2RPL3_9BACL